MTTAMMVETVTAHLQSVIESIYDENFSRAVDEALAAWRVKKCDALAELLDTIDKTWVMDSLAAVDLNGHKNRAEAWWWRASRGANIDVPILLEFVRQELIDRPGFMAHTIKLAQTRNPDPRLAAELVNYIKKPPYYGNKGSDYYAQIFPAIERIGDSRCDAFLVETAKAYRGTRRVLPGVGRVNMRLFYEMAERVAGLAPVVLSGAESALYDKIMAMAKTRSESPDMGAELLKAVYDKPQHIDSRLVYADYLMQKGDPRGEFIALQCGSTGEFRGTRPGRRERELLKTHGRRWLGRLETVLSKGDISYKNGFLSACKYKGASGREAGGETWQGAEEWSTVEAVDISLGIGSRFFLHPVMKSLRRLYGVSTEELCDICRHGESLKWTDLGLGGGYKGWHLQPYLEPLSRCHNLPLLAMLECPIVLEQDLITLLQTEVGQRLKGLRLSNHSVHMERARQLLLERAPGIEVLEFFDHRSNVAVSRLARHNGWIIRYQGAQRLDEVRAVFGDRGHIMDSFAYMTATMSWEGIAHLMVETSYTLSEKRVDALTGRCRRRAASLPIEFRMGE